MKWGILIVLSTWRLRSCVFRSWYLYTAPQLLLVCRAFLWVHSRWEQLQQLRSGVIGGWSLRKSSRPPCHMVDVREAIRYGYGHGWEATWHTRVFSSNLKYESIIKYSHFFVFLYSVLKVSASHPETGTGFLMGHTIHVTALSTRKGSCYGLPASWEPKLCRRNGAFLNRFTCRMKTTAVRSEQRALSRVTNQHHQLCLDIHQILFWLVLWNILYSSIYWE